MGQGRDKTEQKLGSKGSGLSTAPSRRQDDRPQVTRCAVDSIGRTQREGAWMKFDYRQFQASSVQRSNQHCPIEICNFTLSSSCI